MIGTLEEIGDFHRASDGCSTAIEYYESALRALELATPQAATAAGRLHRKMATCYRSRGLLQEALQCLDHSHEHLDERQAPVEAAIAQGVRARVLTQLGDWQQALVHAEAALELLKPTSEHAECALVQAIAALCHGRLGNQEEFEELSNDALATYRRIDDVAGMAKLNNNLGIVYKNACQWEQALACFNASLELNERIGRGRGLARVLTNLGNLYTKMYRPEEAIAHLQRAVRLARSRGDHATWTSSLNSLGRAQVMSGNLESAEKHLRKAAALAEQHSFARSAALADEFTGDLRQAQGRFEEAHSSYEHGLRRARALAPDGDIVGEILRRLAALQLKQGLRSQAISTGRRALRACIGCDEVYEVGYIHRTVAQAQLALGKPAEARKSLEKALAAFEDADIAVEVARTQTALAAELLTTADAVAHRTASQLAAQACLTFRQREDEASWCESALVLAEAHERGGQHEEALLVLCDLEPFCTEADALQQRAHALRQRIEQDLVEQVSGVDTDRNVIGGLASLPQGPEADPEAIHFLQSLCDKTRARCGFLALFAHSPNNDGEPTAPSIRAAYGIHDDKAQQLAAYFDDLETTRLCSTSDADFRKRFPDIAARTPGVLAQALSFGGQRLGILVLERAPGTGSSFSRQELLLATTYAELASEVLGEVLRESTACPATTPAATRPQHPALDDILTQDEAMYEVLGLVQKVAPSHCTVMLSGETGTGKGLIAQRLHELSGRGHKFVAINCAAMPETLLESELFGHDQGAFTGADRKRIGLLEEADGGTVFLDEIGKTSLAMQGKLLQFLDTSSIRPVGSNDYRQVDVRVLCASKIDLKALVDNGSFLEDLFYRLSDFPVHIPPLRQRQGDVRLLAEHFLDRDRQSVDKKVAGISRRAMRLLQAHTWPGNVRELSNCIKRAVVLVDAGQTITARHLTDEVQASLAAEQQHAAADLGLRDQLTRLEAHLIRAAMRKAAGNKSEAARILRISYPTLLQKLKQGVIESPTPAPTVPATEPHNDEA